MVAELPSNERDHWRKRWRQAYGGPHNAEFEVGDLEGFDWHLFSFKIHASVEGGAALDSFSARAGAAPLIGIPSYQGDFERLPGFRFSPGVLKEPPRLGGLRLDYLLFPETLAWTYACTHEDGFCGPYFAML